MLSTGDEDGDDEGDMDRRTQQIDEFIYRISDLPDRKRREVLIGQDLAPLLWNTAGTIEAILQVDSTEAVSFLLDVGIIRTCLKIMESGSGLSKTVATFIIEKILLDNEGLKYICATPERFFSVNRIFVNMVAKLAEEFSPRLLKHIIRCYLRMSDNHRARSALEWRLPETLRDGTFSPYIDPVTGSWLQQLLQIVPVPEPHPVLQAGGGF